MDASMWIIAAIFGLILLALWGFYQVDSGNESKKSAVSTIATDEFHPERTLVKFPMSTNALAGVAIDASHTMLCLISGEDRRYIAAIDLIESEVVVDGKTVTKTSRASQFAGAAIGGVLFGGVGAIIGGLSGKTSTGVDAKGVKLKLTVNDLQDPIHTIDFIELTNTGSTPPQAALREANEWHEMLSAIIKVNERQAAEVAPTTEILAQSMADELHRLHELRRSGALTDEEFQQAKARILSS